MVKSIDQMTSEYVATWKGYRVDGKGRIVLAEKKSAESLVTKASSEPFNVKAYDPKQKQYIAGMANAKEVDRMQEVLSPVGMIVGPYVKNSVMLYQHNHSSPIGLVTTLKAEDQGVLFEGWVGDPASAPLTRMQEECRSLVAQRILKAVSVGFIPHEIRMPTYNDQGMIVDPAMIESWELLELSIVAVPCNAGALFDLKSGEKSSKRLVSYASFPTVGKDGRFIIKTQRRKKMDEELKELLAKQNETLSHIAAGIDAIKTAQDGIQKSIDTMGAAKAAKPDPTEPDGDDKEGKKLKKDFDALTKRIDSLEAGLTEVKKSIDVVIKSLEHVA